MPFRFVLFFAVFGAGTLLPFLARAATANITEIMYDLPGTDTGREWVEVRNTGAEETSFTKWKLFEANTNHGLTLFQGNATTSAGGFAIIADDPAKFLADNPQYSGTLYKSSFSLSNTGETLELRLDGANVYQAAYASSAGAGGDGNSLHYVSNTWQAGIPTPGAEAGAPPVAPPPEAVSGAQDSGTGTTTEETTADAPVSPATPPPRTGSAWTYKPQVYVSAVVPPKGIAGAPVAFDAMAVGAKKEPLQNARYVWSFGDGGTVEGKRVEHTYHYPATYVVMVTAASGEWSATDRKEVILAAPQLVISSVKNGIAGFIEVRNDGNDDIDLSHWTLLSGSGMFTIPQGTVIAAKRSVPFPAAITGLSADSASTALLYPNGSAVVAYAGKPAEPEPLPSAREEKPTVAAATITQPEPPSLPPDSESHESPPTSAPDVAVSEDAPKHPAPVDSSGPSAELLSAVGAVKTGHTLPWLGGTALLALLAVGGYVTMFRPREESGATERLRKEAEEYDLVE